MLRRRSCVANVKVTPSRWFSDTLCSIIASVVQGQGLREVRYLIKVGSVLACKTFQVQHYLPVASRG